MPKPKIDSWCDGMRIYPCTGKEVRSFPCYGGGHNTLCRSCFHKAMLKRKDRNNALVIGPKEEIPKWKSLKVYYRIPAPYKYPTTRKSFIVAYCEYAQMKRGEIFPAFMLTPENLELSAAADARDAELFWDKYKDVYKKSYYLASDLRKDKNIRISLKHNL